MPSSKLRQELLKETHDTKWVCHPGEERIGIARTIIPLAQNEGRRASLCQDMSCLSSRQDQAEEGSGFVVALAHSEETMVMLIYKLHQRVSEG